MKIKEGWKQKNGKYRCPYCEKEYTKRGIGTHIWRKHGEGINWKLNNKNRTAWNKGLRKDTDDRVRRYSESYKKAYKEGKFKNVWQGKSLPIEMRKQISESMKKAHKEGRAWNIGKSRWNNEESYPEKFFKLVIENEFNDKEYKTEYPIGIYSADFAWPHKKKVIEIDGAQHKRFSEYRERDKRKNDFLETEGWEVLRIEWKKFFHDTKKYIKIAKTFIDK
jgi:very-short-patch-repair endonuclease/ribosomal protein L37AE/L43A